MKLDTLLNKLCCPFDHAELNLKIISRNIEDYVLEGILTCTSCRRVYPIIKGIPIMSPDEYRQADLEAPVLQKWSLHLEGKSIKNFKLLSE